MWVKSHALFDPDDNPFMMGVAGHIGNAVLQFKYRQPEKAHESLRLATLDWQMIGPKYEQIAYPERFPPDPSEGTGIDEIGGYSITQLRATDPLVLMLFAGDLRLSDDYPEEAQKWLDRAWSSFQGGNRPRGSTRGKPGRWLTQGWICWSEPKRYVEAFQSISGQVFRTRVEGTYSSFGSGHPSASGIWRIDV